MWATRLSLPRVGWASGCFARRMPAARATNWPRGFLSSVRQVTPPMTMPLSGTGTKDSSAIPGNFGPDSEAEPQAYSGGIESAAELAGDEDHRRHLYERSFAGKNNLRIRCTELDDRGNVKIVNGEFKRAELCTQHGLLPRDLRKLDTAANDIVPSILVRENSILVNLLHIRALIKCNMVLLFDPFGSVDSHTQSVFIYDLEGKLRQNPKTMGGLPYEMRALEAILISVVSALTAEMKMLESLVSLLLKDLEQHVNTDRLRRLLIYDKKLSAFQKKAVLIRDALDETLENDEDMSNMYLTAKSEGHARKEDQHEELELLFESYLKQTDEIVQIADSLDDNIRSTREIINIILDAQRNSLMLYSMKISVIAMGIGAGAFIGALFGMNFKNFFENSDFAFVLTSSFALSLTATVIFLGLRAIARKQKIGIWRGVNYNMSTLQRGRSTDR